MFYLPPAILFESQMTQILSHNQQVRLENCLRNCYHIELRAAKPILDKLKTLPPHLLEDFLEKSQELDIPIPPHKISLPPNDPTFTAPHFHITLYNSPSVRVLYTTTQPNELEPPHLHSFPSLLLILSGSHFQILYADGKKEEDEWPPGVYLLPPDTQAAAYLNLGSTPFEALRFEFKAL